MEAFDPEGARAEWEASLRHAPNAWALRNLAQLEVRAHREEAACELLKQAWEVGPRIPPLAVEYADRLARLRRWDELEALLGSLPAELRGHERILFHAARLAVERRRYADAETALQREYADIREGELTLSDLWHLIREYQAEDRGETVGDAFRERLRREAAPPHAIDFRMFTDESDRYVPPTQTAQRP